jgi:hypothetical protein
MGFLDDIGQRGSESRPKDFRPSVPQAPIREEPRPLKTTAPAPVKVQQTNKVHPAAIWGAVLLVVAAVATAAWFGLQKSAFFASPNTETVANAPSEQETPADKPVAKPRLVRPETAGRSAKAGARRDRGGALGEAESETSLSVTGPLSEGDVSESAATPPETVPDPIAPAPIALPEDDHVYSSEGGGVIAPKLTSLGFVRRLVSGLRVRTSRIELIVSKSGTVERAKIFSTEVHWEDALLLSRAKTFQFVPAYRDGFPVRYRFVLNVDTSP